MMLYFGGTSWLSSTDIFATMTLPSYSFAIFSRTGASMRQGLHQLAQKSTRTGIVFDFSITSSWKFESVASISVMVYERSYFL